jgi:hypothetical protein
MRRSLLFSAALTLVSACARQLTGPTPAVAEVAPDALCTEQLTTSLDVTGSGFAPVLVDSLLSAPKLVLPTVALEQEVDLAGAAASERVTLSGEPDGEHASAVTWTSAEAMAVSVDPSLAVAPGLYAVTITSAAGKSSSLPSALLAVPPPQLTALSQDLACLAQPTALTLSGDLFVRRGATLPSVTVGAATLAPTLGDCRPLPGAGGYEACRSVDVIIDADTQAAGTVQVSVTNPPPLACVSAQRGLTFVDRPKVTSVQPIGICSQAAMQQLVIEGAGFLTVDGLRPTLAIGAQGFTPVASNCTPLPGPMAPVEQCTTLTLTVPRGTFAPGSYPVVVTNPAPADCASSETVTLLVRPPPVITDVAPRNVCSGNATVTLTGTDFLPDARVTLASTQSSMVSVNAAGTSAAAQFAQLEPGGPFTVALDNGDGCSATSSLSVNVIPGPQLFFVDPPVAYNGIATQATAYGTGFTGSVNAVSLVSHDGGTALPLTFTTSALRPGQVQLVIPSGTAAGQYDVLLSDNSSCGARLLDGLTIVDRATLALAAPAVTPSFGHTATQTAVTIEAADGGFAAVPRVYLNPTNAMATTVAAPVGAVSYLSGARITGLAPTTTLPVGSYDVIVVNPSGEVGVATDAFRVVAQPPPTISSLSPGSVSNANPQTFTITGRDFRMPAVSLFCVDASGAPLATNPPATVTGSTSTSVSVSFNASAAGVACVVRVTDGDNQTFSEFSALVITNPAQNLYGATAGPSLVEARRAPVVLGGNATTAARYLHVIAGDDGGTALASVETSALDRLGVPGAFTLQREQLQVPRAYAAGANIGRWLYVAGGSTDGGVALDTVERAVVLDPEQRQEVTDLLLEVGATGLDAGTWYYRVASVMQPTDAFNPDGENLPSDPFPVRLPDLGAQRHLAVTVSWRSDPGAAKYRLYRSPTPGATVGTEQLVAEVTAPATSFKDLGGAPASALRPLPVGSTGRWQTLAAKLSVPREGPGVSWAIDPGDATQAHLYVFGGRQSAGAAAASYEFLTLTLGAGGAQTPAASFTAGNAALGAGRWMLTAAQATNSLSSTIPAGTTYLYWLSGLTAGGSTSTVAEAAPVTAGGQLGTISALQQLQRAGYGNVIAGNLVFVFGGSTGQPDTAVTSGQICGPGVAGCGPVAAQVPPKVANWNAGQAMRAPRTQLGATLSGAFIYVAGGVSSNAPLTISNTTEYRLW